MSRAPCVHFANTRIRVRCRTVDERGTVADPDHSRLEISVEVEALTRPIWGGLSGGVGIWGGAQPGLARFDAGPRLSYLIGRSMRVHADYRQRLLGRAAPGSGPVLTLAASF